MDDREPRLSEDPNEPGLAKLLEEASRLSPWSAPARARGWARLVSAAARERRPHRRALAVAAAAATLALVGAVVLLGQARRGDGGEWRMIELEGTGRLEVSVDAELRLPPIVGGDGERLISIDGGSLRAHVEPQSPGRSFAVVTPHLKVTVVGTRFFVSVESAGTNVSVEQGRVLVSKGSANLLLGPGESIRSDDVRLDALEPIATATHQQAPAPDVVPGLEPAGATPDRSREVSAVSGRAADGVKADRCERERTRARRRACYLSYATDEGLSGQNAMYSLGRLEKEAGDIEKAIEYWSMYARRFPDGVFAPEVSVDLVSGYLALGRHSDAQGEAERFLRRYPADPRRAEVELVRAKTLCAAGQIAEARAALDEMRADGEGEVLFARANCELARGDPAVGVAGLKQYLAAHPRGAHAREAEALLDEAGVLPPRTNEGGSHP